MRLILGSASPRRLELLAQIGVVPDAVISAEIDETPLKDELPRAHADRLSAAKAEVIAAMPEAQGALVLTADTVVSLGRRILGKPAHEGEARRFLSMLSGRRHRVTTGVALKSADRLWTRRVETHVRFKRLSDAEIDAYVASEEWRGKAGGYAIQGRAAAFIPAVNGSYSNVVGLPLAEVAALLHGAGCEGSA
jgi:septum formation protein